MRPRDRRHASAASKSKDRLAGAVSPKRGA